MSCCMRLARMIGMMLLIASHNNFNNETVITCNINIPAITLKGISDGDIIKFYGITLQSYVNYGVNPGMGSE
jgi:hypothetical protein